MRVTYTAPNRAHHYPYARILHRAGHLHRFVSGFTRFSPRSALPEIGDRLLRADHLQNFYIASQKLRFPEWVSDELAHLTKVWMDRLSRRPASESDLFLYYNGTGLDTTRSLRGTGVVSMVEVVNSHVLTQQQLMREEHQLLRLPFREFHAREVRRRVTEYEEADAILAPSQFVKRTFCEQGFAPEKISVVPYGFDLQPASPADRAPDDTFRVLYVGQITPRKGVRYLLDAFARFRHPRKELWIVGGPKEMPGLRGCDIPAHTHFTGVLKGEPLLEAFRKATVFVLPSIEDGQGLVVGEALAQGLPVIVSANCGATDLIEGTGAGFVVPVRDSQAIAHRLQEIADDETLRARMRASAAAIVENLGGWATCSTLLIEALASRLPGA